MPTNDPNTPGNLFTAPQPAAAPPALQNAQPIGTLGGWLIFERKQGGMGEVLICRRPGDDTAVALKSFQLRLFFDPVSRQAFRSELAIWLRLSGNPFILPALGIEQHDARLFALMPAVLPDSRGIATVADLLDHAPTAQEIYTLIWQLALALKFATTSISGVTHGDLKPTNLMWNGHLLQVADFGLAAIGRHATPGLRATPGYESPEYPTTGPSQAGDIYAYGAILRNLIARSAAPRPRYLTDMSDLAARCLTTDPKGRPDAQQVVNALANLMKAHPQELQRPFMSAEQWLPMFKSLHTSAALSVAEGLSQIEAHADALKVLDRVPENRREGQFWILKGNYLSQLDRDEESLQCFEQARHFPLNPEELIAVASDTALSLKRLHRFKEAEKIYLDLLPTVSGPDHLRIVVNLASVYLESQQEQLAIAVLSRYTTDHQHEPLPYAQLGEALERTSDPARALKHYQRAIALDPSMASIQVRIARLLLTHYNDPNGAAAALFAAYQQGSTTEQWFTLSLAVEGILGHTENTNILLERLRGEWPPDEVGRIETQAFQLMRDVLAKLVGKSANPIAADPAAQEMAPSADTDPPPPIENLQTEPPTPTAPPTPPAPADDPNAPFINYRLYMPENRYSVDYYADVEADNYVDSFEHAWNTLRRNPHMGEAEPRTTPFYFSRCPDCSALVLTNRDLGKNLNCRRCEQRNPTTVFDSTRTQTLLSAIETRLGKDPPEPSSGLDLYLLIQLVKDDSAILEQMREICRTEGFALVDTRPKAIRFMIDWVAHDARSSVDRSREVLLAKKRSDSTAAAYRSDTPIELDHLVRRLRIVAAIWSASLTIDPNGGDFFSLLMTGQLDVLENQCRERAAGTTDRSTEHRLLARILMLNKKFHEAKELTLKMASAEPLAADSWVDLADAEFELKDYANAIAHLEHALNLDPRSREAHISLYKCHKATSNQQKAGELSARIAALGGAWLT
jgi:serine/threonine protein kinase